MRREMLTALAAAILFTGIGATPASATDDSGSVWCPRTSPVTVRGEQQELGWMGLYVGSTNVYASATRYVGVGKSNQFNTQSWRGWSKSLLPSGTFAYCEPL